MEKTLLRKLVFFAVFWTMAGTTQVATAEPCEKRLSAAVAALEASELQIQSYRELDVKQTAYIAGLKSQRGQAVELAKAAHPSWFAGNADFLLGALAGAAAVFVGTR